MTYETGTEVFFIESNRIIRKATVVRRSGDFYILRFDEGGGIQLREGRIFPTREQAEATLPGEKVQKKANSPYDYWHWNVNSQKGVDSNTPFWYINSVNRSVDSWHSILQCQM